MSEIDQELHVNNAPEVEVKAKKKEAPTEPMGDTERARAAVLAQLAENS